MSVNLVEMIQGNIRTYAYVMISYLFVDFVQESVHNKVFISLTSKPELPVEFQNTYSNSRYNNNT